MEKASEDPKFKKELPNLSASQVSELIESLNDEIKLATTESDKNRFQKEIEYLIGYQSTLSGFNPNDMDTFNYNVDISHEGKRK